MRTDISYGGRRQLQKMSGRPHSGGKSSTGDELSYGKRDQWRLTTVMARSNQLNCAFLIERLRI
jgi:hypothetical protein